MAHNLRRSLLHESLVNTLYDEEDFGGKASDYEAISDLEHSDDGDSEHDSEFEPSDDDLQDSSKRVLSKEDTLYDVPLAKRLKAGRRPVTKLYGRGVGGNRFVWSSKQSSHRLDRVNRSLPEFVPGPIRDAANCQTIFEFWNVLFNDEMINIIVDCTNTEIENVCSVAMAEGKTMESYEHLTCENEIKAYIAILYHSGMWKTNRVDVKRLWDDENGITFYKCVMSCRRFLFLSQHLRFDIETTRDREDRLAPIRKFWDIFTSNCTKNYNPSRMCTVDEQLHGYRGRCKHRVYMKAKRDKYGLMEKSLNDALTSYLIFSIPYLKKTYCASKNESVPEYFFREVTTPIHGTNRTVTCDNRFTTVPLLLRMVDEPYKLTITGTVSKNKREIPDVMRVSSKTVPDSNFCFSDKITLLNYTPKKHKFVLLLSTFTSSTAITDDKPDLIHHYNKTKGGTDTFDKLCRAFTTARRTRRWPLRHFFSILDQAMVNARILLICKLINEGKLARITAQECMRKVIEQLSKPHLLERCEIPSLSTGIKCGLKTILGVEKIPSGESVEVITAEKYARCSFCNSKNDKKTKSRCGSCERPMCNQHRLGICQECACLG